MSWTRAWLSGDNSCTCSYCDVMFVVLEYKDFWRSTGFWHGWRSITSASYEAYDLRGFMQTTIPTCILFCWPGVVTKGVWGGWRRLLICCGLAGMRGSVIFIIDTREVQRKRLWIHGRIPCLILHSHSQGRLDYNMHLSTLWIPLVWSKHLDRFDKCRWLVPKFVHYSGATALPTTYR